MFKNQKMKMMKYHHVTGRARGSVWWAVIAGLVIVIPLAVISINAVVSSQSSANSDSDDQSSTPEWETVQERSFEIIVTAKGQVEAGKQVEIRNQVQGKTTLVDIVPEGTIVKKGDIVAKLADDELIKLIEEERLSVASAKADVVSSQKSLEIKLITAKTTREAAEVTRDLADLELKKWKSGVVAQRRSELDLALEKATRDEERTTREHKKSVELLRDQFISDNELETDYIAMIEAKAALKTAKLNIKVYNEFEEPKERRQFTSDLDQAEATLSTTIAESERELEQVRSDLEAKQLQLKIREERLTEYEQQLAATTLITPTDGVVVYGSTVSSGYSRDDDQISKGSTVYFNQTIVVIPDTNTMKAALLVHESLIASVELGNKASIQVDALQGKPVLGTVVKIDQAAEDGGRWNRELRRYRVHIELEKTPATSLLKPAMRCDGNIMIDKVVDQIAIPIQAVYSEKRKRFCYVPAGTGKIEKREIKVGRANESHVEIVSGLEVDDKVLLRLPLPGELINS